MSRRLATAVTGLAVVVALALAAPAGADEVLTVVSTDVSAYPLVRLVVAAPSRLGTQAPASAFVLREAGVAQAVTVDALPVDQLDVALVIDTSGSMAGAPLAAAKAAASSFLGQLPATATVSVVGFGGTPAVVSPRSANRVAQLNAVGALTAGGQTALYDAIGRGLAQLGTGGRRVVVVLSDGGDTASVATLDTTVGALTGAGVTLFAVGLTTPESNPAALARLATASGGRAVAASDPTGLAGAFDAIAGQLVRQYTLSYQSGGHGGTDVEVVVEAGGARATGTSRLTLPAAPVVGPAVTVAPAVEPAVPAVAPASTAAPGAGATWALVLGGALVGLGLLGLGLAAFGARSPRARGLAPRRRSAGVADMARRAGTLGERVLSRSGGLGPVNAALETAGVDVRAGELLLGMAGAFVLAAGAGWALLGPLGGAILGMVVPVAMRIGLDVMGRRRRRRFDDQLAETLQIISGSLRAGHGLAQAIDTVGRQAEAPTAEEFRRLAIETRLGRDFIDALTSLAARMGSDDFRWVCQAMEIQREVGGDLAEILDNVANTTRDRTRIRRQVSALSAEGRMSAWVLMILPFGLGGMMAVTNRSYLSPLFGTGTGYLLLAIGAGLLVVGGLWLRQIVKPIF